MSNGLVFVDTNVWVAHFVEDHPFHARAEIILTRLLNEENLLCISGQVVRELSAVCTLGRTLARPLSWQELRSSLEALLAQTVCLFDSEASIQQLIALGTRYAVIGRQVHDTNLVAVMLTHGVTRLATFNPDDFKRFAEIDLIVN